MSQDLDLSRRAVAAGWKWQAGTRCIDVFLEHGRVAGVMPYRLTERGWIHDVTSVEGTHETQAVTVVDGRAFGYAFGHSLERAMCNGPDFNDAATRGVLLQQVRERLDNPLVYTAPVIGLDGACKWFAISPTAENAFVFGPEWEGDSETAALLAAFEAAPNR